jgi:hypothetical protein
LNGFIDIDSMLPASMQRTLTLMPSGFDPANRAEQMLCGVCVERVQGERLATLQQLELSGRHDEV